MPRSYKIKLVILGALAVVAISAGVGWWSLLPTQFARVYFLNIGQGDAILIRSPHGKTVLIDGGKDNAVLRELAAVLPIDERKIDVVMATHPDLDHYGGLIAVLSTYAVGVFLDNGAAKEAVAYAQLKQLVADKKIPYFIERQGEEIILGDGAKVQILYPDNDLLKLKDSNDGSMVALVTYGDEKVVLTGDAPITVEQKLVGQYGDLLKAQILKLGHHGSKTSSSEIFLETVAPDVAVISSGANNSYGHPHKEVIDRLRELRIPYLNTANEGRQCFKLFLHSWQPC
jgi:competence protein ComEC